MQVQIVDGWLQGEMKVTQIISPFYNERPADCPITLLVIHNISLPPNKYGGPHVAELFTGKLDPDGDPYFQNIYQMQVSSHLFIRRDGEIIQFVPFNKRAWHAGKSLFNGRENCNDFSIGIEMEGSDNDAFTEIQYAQLAKITDILKSSYPIQNIVGHSDIAPDRKTDPGPYFEWQNYLNRLDKR
ncbi:1,6-anhydro-N-acetylmuramyl-L-alanine amidase AmpD [Orbaceae bacterium ESL0721]|nr:1,6-anhydro-N-acetylmuramyl-L-alanine amidase AmpD [Orbaceae bacterium ESL0721]